MKKLIIFIPGNPSVPGIYDDFIKDITKQLSLSKNSIVKILPHLGQCNSREIRLKRINVFDVIEDHRKSIDQLIKQEKADQVILMGHSLGSAVSIYLHNELQHEIDQFIILCPFTGPSKNNQHFLRKFKNPISRIGMINLTKVLLVNQKVSQLAFRKWLGDNPYNEHIANQIKQRNYLKNFFTLVSTYLNDFEKLEIKKHLTQMDSDKSFFVFVPNDYWVPDEVKNFVPAKAQSIICNDVQHDFCLFKPQYEKVASIVVGRLKSN